MKSTIITILAIALFSSGIYAQNSEWEQEAKLVYNIGGNSPVPFPAEIRSVEKYNPRFNPGWEWAVTRWLSPHIGISSGIGMNIEGMITEATVKSYYTSIVKDEDAVSGYFTGLVHTEHTALLATLPIMANYRIRSNKLKCRIGCYVGCRLTGEFEGYVTDGYLRNLTPTGEKIEFTDGEKGTYDFSDELRRFQFGAQVGFSWFFYRNLSLSADLRYGVGDTFKKGFDAITFKMHPVYAAVGLGLRL